MRMRDLPIAAAVLMLSFVMSEARAQDAEAGKRVFNSCRACHSVEPGQNKIGPSLAGVVGRPAGEVEGFNYSDAMKSADVVWDEENLGKYLTDPKGFIPGNKMIFVGIKDEEALANLIAYLEAPS
ncbi:MAG TPA: cytochrome c family protein [Arenibaculum sp.]|nr:cytochrome c family protein [Arenibaculum sp.]